MGFLSGPSRIEDDVALSDDGRIAASAGGAADGTGGLVIVYDTTTHQEIGRITTENEAGAADVSPDGRSVIVSDGTAAYRDDVTTGRVDKVDLHAFRARARSLRRPGSRIAVTTQRDGDTP